MGYHIVDGASTAWMETGGLETSLLIGSTRQITQKNWTIKYLWYGADFNGVGFLS